jgi:hypothetical protein
MAAIELAAPARASPARRSPPHPSVVTTKAALEMKLRFAGEPSAEAPCTIQIPGWTSTGSTACAAGS